jgi:hypothetical protein
MIITNIPGFTAEASLYKTSGHYHCVVMSGYSEGRRGVISQLKGSVFHRPFGGGVFGTIEDYYACKQACESAYSACLDTCEGTVGSPIGSTHCIICDQNYQACLQGCTGDIA